MNFKRFGCPQVILAKILSSKNLLPCKILILSNFSPYRHHCYTRIKSIKSDCSIDENDLWGRIQHFPFTHVILRLDAKAVKRIRGCVVIFILVAVYGKKVPEEILLAICHWKSRNLWTLIFGTLFLSACALSSKFCYFSRSQSSLFRTFVNCLLYVMQYVCLNLNPGFISFGYLKNHF